MDGPKLNDDFKVRDDVSNVSLSKAVYNIGAGVSAPTFFERRSRNVQMKNGRTTSGYGFVVRRRFSRRMAANIRILDSLHFSLDKKALSA